MRRQKIHGMNFQIEPAIQSARDQSYFSDTPRNNNACYTLGMVESYWQKLHTKPANNNAGVSGLANALHAFSDINSIPATHSEANVHFSKKKIQRVTCCRVAVCLGRL